jgi:3-dehydroquinate synthase
LFAPIPTDGEGTLKIDVSLPAKPYSIFIGNNLFTNLPEEMVGQLRSGTGILVFTDRNVLKHCYPVVDQGLKGMGIRVEEFVIPGGENDKTLDTLSRCYEQMALTGFDRDSTILALGGGVVGDLAGFAASTYMRGIRLIHIPTTLLAMVDSAIGGKNAINFPWGKNMVGTFYQPSSILVDLAFLDSLPEEAYRDGLAEIVKYSVIEGHELLSIVRDRVNSILERDVDSLADIVARCCGIKAEIVARDEFDRTVRTTLNFGHTIGHALEAAGSYSSYSHGQALSIGMRGAFRISSHYGLVSRDEERLLEDILERFGLPLTWNIEGVGTEEIWRYLVRDKKARGDRLDFVLTKGFGTVIIRDIKGDKGLILKVLDELQEQ